MGITFDGFTPIDGGICAPKGFKAAGIHCGVRKNKEKYDLAVICADKPCAAAAVYTQNKVAGAPIKVTKKNLKNGCASAMVVNSGNANTCNENGIEIATQMCQITGASLNIKPEDVIVASTGVIGQPLSIEPFKTGIPNAVQNLSVQGSSDAAVAIMTTDTRKKEFAFEVTIGGKVCRLGGIAKGSGMINPNMATLLCFLTTDAAIHPKMLSQALKHVCKNTFNMVTIDGDTSTNDMACILASGLAGNREIVKESEDYDRFINALYILMMNLSREIARDGEGATKLIECAVSGAKSEDDAKAVAKAVAASALVKSAMFGNDANWGRVLCAIGYSGANVNAGKIGLTFHSKAGAIEVCKNGTGVNFSEVLAKNILSEGEIKILISLNDGDEDAMAWGCDLTYDYVKINGDYRT